MHWKFGIRLTIPLVLLCLISFRGAKAQIQQAEYFWDTDPGQGYGNPITASDGNLDHAIEELFASGIQVPPSNGIPFPCEG